MQLITMQQRLIMRLQKQFRMLAYKIYILELVIGL